MKKVAIVAQGLGDGGAERVASILANGLSKYYTVLFVAAYSSDKEYVLNDHVQYTYIDVSAKNGIERLEKRNKRIKKVIKEFGADVIISFVINELLYCNLSNIAPIIYSLRIDPAKVLKQRIKGKMCLFSYRRANAIVFQTRDAKNSFEEKIQKKGVVIGNPLTSDLPYWNGTNCKREIITACRLTEQKNIPLMLEAFSEFHKTHPEFKLKIYGKGPELNKLLGMVKSLQLMEFVDFPGHSTDIHEIMSNAMIFTLTSDYEGLSNSMLEALAIGIPTVCTDCPPGGAAEYITNAENGFLVPVGGKKEIVEAWTRLAKDEDLRCAFSKKSMTIRDELEMNRIIEKWHLLIENSSGGKK